jgi:spermidine/putrescine transport system ATP-binding protein
VFVAGFIGTANLLPATVDSVSGGGAVATLAAGHRVEVPIGHGEFAPGGAAIVMLRPERIKLTIGPADPRWSAVPVTVTDIVFQGPVLRCALRDDGGGEIVANIDDDERPEGLERGAQMTASWDPSGARLLPPRQATRAVVE